MSKENKQSFVLIYSNDTFDVYYDKDTRRYHIDVFDDGHYWDEVWFDAYKVIDAHEEKETDNRVEKIIEKLGLVKSSIKEEIPEARRYFDADGMEYFIGKLIDWIKGL